MCGSSAAIAKKPFNSTLHGKTLGHYVTAEHAALVRARALGPEASQKEAKEAEEAIARAEEAQAAPLTKEEALAAAEAEGLTLVPNHTSTSGYKFVTVASGRSGARSGAGAIGGHARP